MAVKGHSAVLEFGDAATHAETNDWTKIAKVIELKPPTVKADDIDTSTMESEEQFEEFDPGWAQGGEPEATVQFNADDNETVYGLFRQPKGFRITFSNGSHWKFNGYLNEFGNETERKGIVTTKVKFKVSGKPVFVKTPA
jgi:hypothetical protein